MRSAAPPQGFAAIPRRRFAPVIAPFLAQRWWAAGIAIVAFAQLTAVELGLSALGCPLRDLAGIRCPSCGLTTATLQLCHREWYSGISTHAFAPLFLFIILGSAVLAIVPDVWRNRLRLEVERFEVRTGFVPALAIALLLYWALRSLLGG